MRFKITILFLFLGLFASAQFHSPYYHASVVDSLILKHRGDTLFHIRLSHNRDTLFINNSYFVGGGGGITGTTYTAGYGLGLSGTTFYNSRYWGLQDSLKTSLTGLVLATAGKLTAITNNSSNWDNGYAYRLTGATGSAPLTLGLSGNALTGSIDTSTAKTGLANLYQLGLKANKATTITINGTAYDLSSNRSWTIPNYWQRTSTTLSPTTAQDNLQVYSNQYTTGDFENTHSGSDPAKAVYGYIYGSNAAPNYAFYATASGGSSNYSFYGNAGMFLQNDSSYFGNYLRISPISAPSPVTDKLYNVGHSLYWNGTRIDTSYTISCTNPIWTYEVGTDYQTTFTVSFPLKATSQVVFNGNILRNTQWSGVGTSIITLSLDIRVYDFISIIQ